MRDVMWKKGEKDVNRLLESKGFEVFDVSNDEKYWALDIDLLAKKEEKITRIEVKTDTKIHNTGNLYIEQIVDITTGEIGWGQYTKAEWLGYIDDYKHKVHFVNVPLLKHYIQNNKSKLKEVTAPDYDWQGNIRRYSRGYLVPLDSIKDITTTMRLI